MNTLENQLQEVREELASLDPNNRDNLVKIANLKNREAELVAQIAAEAQQKQIIEEKEVLVQTAQEENAFELDNLTIEGVGSMRQMCVDEESYQLIRVAVQSLLNEKSEKFISELTEYRLRNQEELRAADERELQLQRQNDDLQERIESVMEENETLRKQNHQLTNEIGDVMKNRDNAAQQLDDAQEEIRRLNDQVDDLRKEIAVGARHAPKVIDTNEQIRQAAEAYKASRIKITNKRWEDDLKKTHYIAELVENGEQVRFHYFDLGKYLEVTEEEAARFRAELEANREDHQPLVEPESIKEIDTFQPSPIEPPEFVPAPTGISEETEGTNQSMGQVTREEFEQALRRIDRLEDRANINREVA